MSLIEIIFRRPLPTIIIKGLSVVFVTLLIGLMVFVTFADGRRLVRGFLPEKDEQVEEKTEPQAEENSKGSTDVKKADTAR